MKKLALGALFVGLMAACGGGSDSKTVVTGDDSGVDSGPTVCSPLTQTGCNAGEKCTWIWDQLPPSGQTTPDPIGHIGCTAAGTLALGGNCGARALGGDMCAAGLACSSGECKTICDPNGATAAAACDDNHHCAQYQNFFVSGATTIAGVCDPACDPLTQNLKVGTNVTACGSPMPAAPTIGCYGFEDFSCSGVAPTVDNATALTLTDRVPPAGAYLNACAPGFVGLLYSSNDGSMMGICTGLCAALETDNTVAHKLNTKGDPMALGKFPTDAAPVVGHATCAPASAKGRGSSGSACEFMWPFNVDQAGMLKDTPYVDTLGYCIQLASYTYDSNGDGQNDMPFPDCATLPPRSATTTGDADDAADWGCQKVANSMLTAADGKKVIPSVNPALRDMRPIRTVARAETLSAHTFN